MSFTNAGETFALDAAYNRSLWVGVSSTTPTETGTGITEPSGGAYARQPITNASWAAAVAGAPSSKATSATVTFPTASADWVAGANLTHWVIFDAVTAGNAVSYGALSTAKPVLNGDTASFAPGGITHTLD